MDLYLFQSHAEGFEMTFSWKGKRVLITGGAGMIGRELVEQLSELGANIMVWDNDLNRLKELKHVKWKMFTLINQNLVDDFMDEFKPEFVFHLAGVKGNPKMTNEKPVDFMGPMLKFDTNMILAAQTYGVKRFLYTSSIAVENPKTDKY